MSSGNVGIGINNPSAKLEVKGDIKVTGNNSTIVQPDWTLPILKNKWVNYSTTYNPAGFFKDSLGIVHLRGLIKGGSTRKAIFTLPAGYRPSFQEILVVQTSSSPGRLDVKTNGEVYPYVNSEWVSLDGITFRAKN
jgi:hypothetical protein